jgi:hypothetical protein
MFRGEKMVTKRELLRKIGALESLNDQLISELRYVDELMRQIGFSEGLKSVKETAAEIIEEQQKQTPHEYQD